MESIRPEFQSQLHHFLAVYSGASHSTFLSLQFPDHEVERITVSIYIIEL